MVVGNVRCAGVTPSPITGPAQNKLKTRIHTHRTAGGLASIGILAALLCNLDKAKKCRKVDGPPNLKQIMVTLTCTGRQL